MNCYHFRATQKSIPDSQELIRLEGGIKCPPTLLPCLGLMLVKWQKNKTMTVEIDALGQEIPYVRVLPHCALV